MPANVHDPDAVDAYMERLDHPLKAEVQAVRDLIKGVDSRITEQVKWNAPSFSYMGYLATFNLRRLTTSTLSGTTAPSSRTRPGCSRAAIRTGA